MSTHKVTAVGAQTSLWDRKRRAGQRMVIGFEAAHVDDDLRYLVREIQPAGFILFARNLEDPAQVRELNRELASLVDPSTPALLSVDQEGGRVQRIRAPATVWPSMRQVADADADVTAVGRALGLELAAMGFNLDFAPVADVDSNPDNPVIGDRSFGRSPERVAQRVVQMLQGLQGAGIIACAKHFPGHGDTHTDSHHDLPVVEEELGRLRTRELVPFEAAVRAGVGAVMSAHVVFPALDEELPATLSERVIPQLLRRELGFDGVVFSDDMEMRAVAGRWDIPTQARRATLASVDVLLCCRSPALQMEMFTELVRSQEREQALDRASEASALRVHRLRERFLRSEQPQPDLDILGRHDHQALADAIRFRGA